MSADGQRRAPIRRILGAAVLLSLLLPLWHSSAAHLSGADTVAVLEHATDTPFEDPEALGEACPVCAAASQQSPGLVATTPPADVHSPLTSAAQIPNDLRFAAQPDHRVASPRGPPSPMV